MGWRSMGSSAFALVLLLVCFLSVPGLGAGVAKAASAPEAHGSVEQVYATGLGAGAKVTLFDSAGNAVGTQGADELGGVLFREVTPGSGYRISVGSGPKSGAVRVLTQQSAPPNTSIYDQKIEPHGYQYLTTRDGTELAIDVHPPQDVAKILTGAIPSPEELQEKAATGGKLSLPPEIEEKLKEIPGVGPGLEGLSELLGGLSGGLLGAKKGSAPPANRRRPPPARAARPTRRTPPTPPRIPSRARSNCPTSRPVRRRR